MIVARKEASLSEDLFLIRGIGIMLMVFGHVIGGSVNKGVRRLYSPDNDLLRVIVEFIYTFHMPIFFICAGIAFALFSKPQPFTKFFASKFHRLFVPLIIWAPVFLIIQSIYREQPLSLSLIAETVLFPSSIFWFLHTLFVVSVVCFVATRLTSLGDHFYLPFSMALYALLIVFDVEEIGGFNIVRYAYWNLFLASGFAAGQYVSDMRQRLSEQSISILLAYSLSIIGAMLVVYWLMPERWYSYTKLVNGLLFFVALELIAIVMSRSSSGFTYRMVMALGIASMTIYLLHLFISSPLREMLVSVFSITNIYLHLGAAMFAGIGLPFLIHRWLASNNRVLAYSLGMGLRSKTKLNMNGKAYKI